MVCRFPSSSFRVVPGDIELMDRYYCHRWSCGREGVVVIYYKGQVVLVFVFPYTTGITRYIRCSIQKSMNIVTVSGLGRWTYDPVYSV